jgi:hypothetical protein
MVAPLVSLLVTVAVVASGCSGASSPQAAATPAATTTRPTVAPTLPAADRAAAAAVSTAARAMQAVRSYRFAVGERLVATSTQSSRLVGSVVRGEGLIYVLTVGGKRTEVVRLRRATYVRVFPHRWSRLRKPRQLANPTATLLAVLRRMIPTSLRQVGRGRVVTGVVPAASARSAGLPPTQAPARAVVTVDKAGHVRVLRLMARTTANGHAVVIALRAAYSGFGRVARISRPR